jgi:hypothetical protein
MNDSTHAENHWNCISHFVSVVFDVEIVAPVWEMMFKSLQTTRQKNCKQNTSHIATTSKKFTITTCCINQSSELTSLHSIYRSRVSAIQRARRRWHGALGGGPRYRRLQPVENSEAEMVNHGGATGFSISYNHDVDDSVWVLVGGAPGTTMRHQLSWALARGELRDGATTPLIAIEGDGVSTLVAAVVAQSSRGWGSRGSGRWIWRVEFGRCDGFWYRSTQFRGWGSGAQTDLGNGLGVASTQNTLMCRITS